MSNKISVIIKPPFAFKEVHQISPNGELIKIWDSPIVAERQLGINKTGISNACRGKTMTSGGFKWKYKIDCNE